MKKQLQLWLLVALFFGPLLVAWVWYAYFEDLRPATTVNKGDLVQPVVALSDLYLYPRDGGESRTPFGEDWVIVVLAADVCDSKCEQALYVTRQVWIRLNKDAVRVRRVLLAGRDVSYPVEEHRDIDVYTLDQNALARFRFENRPELAGTDRVYLVDPRGFLMMSYPLDLEPVMLHDDLKRLLRYSDDK